MRKFKKFFVLGLIALIVPVTVIASYWWWWLDQWDAAMHASVMSGAH